MLRSSYKKENRPSGFTLVELMVSIALFSVIVAIASGGFVQALRSERQVSAMMSAESNVSLVLEQMTREMRTGYLFCHSVTSTSPLPACSTPTTPCTINPATQAWTCPNIEFYNSDKEKVDYALQNGFLERADEAEASGTFQPMTSNNVSTTYLMFTIFGNLEGDHWNPRITIAVGVQPNDNTVTWSTANLETTVSSRSIDASDQPGSLP
jgi:prepilin-type N-terminal cleavage/methylation domain-containing protein